MMIKKVFRDVMHGVHSDDYLGFHQAKNLVKSTTPVEGYDVYIVPTKNEEETTLRVTTSFDDKIIGYVNIIAGGHFRISTAYSAKKRKLVYKGWFATRNQAIQELISQKEEFCLVH